MEFEPKVWPGETPIGEAVDCRLCELARHRSRVIWGEGNPDAPVYVLLDNPGEREDREGEAFVCGTRQTLQAGLAHVGLTERDVYVTYLLKCRPKRAYNKIEARQACSGYLTIQLERRPKVLFCLGNTVVQTFFDDPEAEVKHLRGKPLQRDGMEIVVSYHPLAVRRRPNLLPLFLADCDRLGELAMSKTR